eukprot:scaffold51404_cov67-Attheya_sp.AAC.1
MEKRELTEEWRNIVGLLIGNANALHGIIFLKHKVRHKVHGFETMTIRDIHEKQEKMGGNTKTTRLFVRRPQVFMGSMSFAPHSTLAQLDGMMQLILIIMGSAHAFLLLLLLICHTSIISHQWTLLHQTQNDPSSFFVVGGRIGHY